MRWIEVLLRAAKGYGRDRCAIFAAGVTYYALLSLFPLALLVVGTLGFLVTDPEQQQRVVDELMETLPLSGDGRQELEGVVDSVVAARGALGLVGLVLTAYSASALFGAVRTALNAVFHVERQRPFVLGKAIDLGLVGSFGALLLLSFAMTVAIAFAQRHAEAIAGEEFATLSVWLASLLYLLVPPVVTGLVFLLLFTRVANAGLTVREVVPGVLVAALLFELVKVGFAQYIASFGDYDATYGALGFVVVLLLFFNVAAQVMLLGAECARANAEVLGAAGELREVGALSVRVAGLRQRRGLGWLPVLPVSEAVPGALDGRFAPVSDAGGGVSEAGGCDRRAVEAGAGSKLVVGAGLVALVVATLLRRPRGG